MRFGSGRHWLCVAVLASFCQASAAEERSAAPTPNVSVKRDCADARGATKKECEKVAAKIDAQAANPALSTPTEEAHSTADYVHHSSPVVRTPAEVAQDKKAKTERKSESPKPAPQKPEPSKPAPK